MIDIETFNPETVENVQWIRFEKGEGSIGGNLHPKAPLPNPWRIAGLTRNTVEKLSAITGIAIEER